MDMIIHKHTNMTVYEFMEDFDNVELDDYEWKEQLRDAVKEFNEEHNTQYDPDKTLTQYIQRNGKNK